MDAKTTIKNAAKLTRHNYKGENVYTLIMEDGTRHQVRKSHREYPSAYGYSMTVNGSSRGSLGAYFLFGASQSGEGADRFFQIEHDPSQDVAADAADVVGPGWTRKSARAQRWIYRSILAQKSVDCFNRSNERNGDPKRYQVGDVYSSEIPQPGMIRGIQEVDGVFTGKVAGKDGHVVTLCQDGIWRMLATQEEIHGEPTQDADTDTDTQEEQDDRPTTLEDATRRVGAGAAAEQVIKQSKHACSGRSFMVFTGGLGERMADSLGGPEGAINEGATRLAWWFASDGEQLGDQDLREGDFVICARRLTQEEQERIASVSDLVGEPRTTAEAMATDAPEIKVCPAMALYRERVAELQAHAQEIAEALDVLEDPEQVDGSHLGNLDYVAGGLAQAWEAVQELRGDSEEDDQEWRNEQAREAGQLGGVDAYNDSMGWGSEPVED